MTHLSPILNHQKRSLYLWGWCKGYRREKESGRNRSKCKNS